MAPPSLSRLPPELANDTIDQILLRLPPDEPECLVRASLLNKPWRKRLLDATFHHDYRKFHGAPPLLGFLQECFQGDRTRRFIPTTAASPFSQSAFGCHSCYVLDCRHGSVLLHNIYHDSLIVRDPINGVQHCLPPEPMYPCNHITAAVLCALDGCDHLNCHGGPFRVVFGATADEELVEESLTWVSVYSSEIEIETWTAPTSIHLGPVRVSNDMMGPSLHVDDALYFILEDGHRILKYDLGKDVLTVINDMPALNVGNMLLVTVDGGLGVAGVIGYSLQLWSWQVGADGVDGWVKGRVIDLEMMISIGIGDPMSRLQVVGFAECACAIFVSAKNVGIFTVELKSSLVRKVSDVANFQAIFPYESFYTPDQ
ncbi:hypothetical protein ACP70R_031197 [Stipagrostis hirtigluma subsp. patula]